MNHPWITSKQSSEIPPEALKDIQQNLKKFNGKFKLEQAVYTYLAMNAATVEDEKYLREMFLKMDTSKDGKINKVEFVEGMAKSNKNTYTKVELEEIFSEIDSDNSGMIDYSEFLRAALNKTKLLSENNLHAAFKFFDLDGNGVITKDELSEVFTKGNANLNDKLCEAMIGEIDKNKDKSISFEEFKQMMQNGLKAAQK